MKISFITTVYNEEKTIDAFLTSLTKQSKLPNEIIIVDGGSVDGTASKISSFQKSLSKKHKKITFKFVTKKGNRSVGRNEAVNQATGDIIVCSDAGNTLDRDWVKNITNPFVNKKVDVVAGYYRGEAKNVFQKSVVPYALVMPDKVNPDNFLPATRSIAFTKASWKKVGGFDETLSHNEDYVFALKLKESGAKIVFAKDAVVNWIPRNTYKQAFIMMFRFAFGDAEAGVFRSKVFLLFARYFLGLYFIFLIVLYKSLFGLFILACLLLGYFVWAITKNYRYVKDTRSFVILPLLQLTADAAVISGTLLGLLKKSKKFKLAQFIKSNILLLIFIAVYLVLLLPILLWGSPNQFHPFPYHMDEWHQLQAVRSTFAYGTPNIAGAANGTMFHFVLSGLYLIPFNLIDFINLAVIKIDDLALRERIFELLRLNTLFWGVLSIAVIYKIAQLLKIPILVTVILFLFTPVWLSLSSIFKYDIDLMFWILLSLYLILRFAKKPTANKYFLASIPVGLAMAVKISTLPLVPIYLLSYFWFMPKSKWNVLHVIIGGVLTISLLLIFGMPDTLFGKGNISHYFYENVVQFAASSANYQLGMSPYQYIFTKHYMVIFGHVLYFTTIAAILYLIFSFYKNGFKRLELFILISFGLFIVSLLPLAVYAGMNRSLVLLPFLVIIIGLAVKQILQMHFGKTLLIVFFSFLIPFQIAESLVWIQLRLAQNPYVASSQWIQEHIPKQTYLGIENIPIYQPLPDIVQKEYYFREADIPTNYLYNYQIVDVTTETLPKVIVIGNAELNQQLFKKSPKNELLKRMRKEGYKSAAIFSPDFRYYSYFGNGIDFHMAGMVALPNSITVYFRQ